MRRPTLDTIATALMASAAAVVLWTNIGPRFTRPQGPPVPEIPLSVLERYQKGNRDAKTTLIVFSDFECPSCRQFALDLMPTLERDYVSGGRVKVAFRHLPLRIHAFATRAAEASECAARQGRFWAYHDLLFSNQGRFRDKDLIDYARETEIDMTAFEKCAAGEASPVVREAAAEAARLNVMATPTFMIGTTDSDSRVRVTSVIRGAAERAIRHALDQAISQSAEVR